MTDSTDTKRLYILEMVERGEIDAAEAMRQMAALGTDRESWAPDRPSSVADEPTLPTLSPIDPDIAHWKRWWVIPFWIGLAVMMVAGLLMLSALQTSGMGFWFFCAWLPFLVGVAVLALAWGSRTSRWLHVRVNTGQDEWPRKIAVSFPIPTRLVAGLLRVAGPHVPGLRERLNGTALDELILALDETTSSQTPFYVDVAEGENGERVQVYIG